MEMDLIEHCYKVFLLCNVSLLYAVLLIYLQGAYSPQRRPVQLYYRIF